MPLVTVIVPVYNAEKWIAKTLESALAQTLKDIEIIVVDDCSTDASVAITKRYPVTLIRHSENVGHGSALNTGLHNAHGEFIAFLDADDLWAPEKLAYCVAELQANCGAVLCYSNGWAIGENDEKLWPLLPSGHMPPTPAQLLLNCVINCPAQVVVRSSMITPFSHWLQPNDHDQWIRMREKGEFVYVDEPLAFYRKHPAQMSMRRRQWEDGFEILKSARQRYPYSLRTVTKRLAVIHYRLGEHDLRNGAKMRGFTHWIAAAFLDPLRAVQVALRRS
jgi:glycosyltransferase involved in cell wall biosynthesis